MRMNVKRIVIKYKVNIYIYYLNQMEYIIDNLM